MENILKEVSDFLLKNKLVIQVAESATGGLVSSYLTDISGSSNYTTLNFITYSNSSKIKVLDVSEKTIKQFGAVSEQTALEMAQGLIRNYDCDIALSTTGIADISPEGEKPKGLIYFSIANALYSKVIKYQAPKELNRIETKQDFAKKAIEELLVFLKENYQSC